MVDGGRGDPGRRLRRQVELEPVDQKLQLGFWMGVTGEQDLASVGGRQMNVYHLEGGEIFRAHGVQSGRAPGHEGDGSG